MSGPHDPWSALAALLEEPEIEAMITRMSRSDQNKAVEGIEHFNRMMGLPSLLDQYPAYAEGFVEEMRHWLAKRTRRKPR